MRHHAVGVECLLPQVVDLRGQKLWRTTWPLFQRQLPQHGRFYLCSHHCLQVTEVLAIAILTSKVSIVLSPDPISRATPFTLTLTGSMDEAGRAFLMDKLLARWWYSVDSRVARTMWVARRTLILRSRHCVLSTKFGSLGGLPSMWRGGYQSISKMICRIQWSNRKDWQEAISIFLPSNNSTTSTESIFNPSGWHVAVGSASHTCSLIRESFSRPCCCRWNPLVV